VYCFLTDNDKEPWANLAAGQKVKLKGFYPENQNTGHPAIRQCVIVEHGPSTAVVLSAEQLANEYSKAKDATEAKYKLKGVVVTGEIVSKKQPPFGGPLVSLKGNDKFQVECRMVEARWMTDPLMVGQKVKLHGVFEDLQGNDNVVKLGSCLVISRP
jgi:hypothetical protein